MFTDAAVKAIEDSLDAADILRIGAQGGGCSGLNYVIELAEKVSDDDIVINLDLNLVIIRLRQLVVAAPPFSQAQKTWQPIKLEKFQK